MEWRLSMPDSLYLMSMGLTETAECYTHLSSSVLQTLSGVALPCSTTTPFKVLVIGGAPSSKTFIIYPGNK